MRIEIITPESSLYQGEATAVTVPSLQGPFTMLEHHAAIVAILEKGKVTLTVPVTNTGKREGTETVQVYVKRLNDDGAPLKALKGFQKLALKAGETKTATITLDGEAFEYYDANIDELSVMPGRYQILYGTSSRDKDLQTLDFVVN